MKIWLAATLTFWIGVLLVAFVTDEDDLAAWGTLLAMLSFLAWIFVWLWKWALA